MIKIGFYLENQNIKDVDLSQPELGNPGCGGTEYLFSALPYYLAKLHGDKCETILFANHTGNLIRNVKSFQVSDVIAAAKAAKEYSCDFFIYRPYRHTQEDLLETLSELTLPSIAWAHITPLGEHLRELAKHKYVKALVCVEHEQYDLIQDSPIYKKLTYIVNGFDLDGFSLAEKPPKDPNLVVYLGSLVPQKGFHLLAKVWKQIIARVPSAQLVVIGSGALYNENAKLGPWKIAEKSYEEKYIIPYLADDKGELHPSVTLMGKLGLEKKEILYRALIGVPNPTGQTENCPGSALEFQATGTAVVSGAYNGLLDTVQHKITGLLGKTENDLMNNICTLLEAPDEAIKLGENGQTFIQERYNLTKITSEWITLFNNLANKKRPKRYPFKKNFHQHTKWATMINRFLQNNIGKLFYWPTILEIKHFLKTKLHL